MLEIKLNLLKETNPELFTRIKDHVSAENINFQLFNSESGDVNVLYNDIALHCKKNPQAEVLREFNRIKPDSSTIVIVTGMGLGYFIKRFYQDSKCRIIVFEPDLNILKFTLDAVDFSEELRSNRVFITTNPKEVIKILNSVYVYKNKVVATKLASVDRIYPEKIETLMQEMNKTVPTLSSNYATLFKYSWNWFYAALYKFKGDKKDSAINILENKFKNKTALIVSAGPSLDKNIEIIKQNRDKFIIFCVSVAYKKLITAGITPDFTIHLDFVGTRAIIEYEHSGTNLIVHPAAHKNILETLKPNRSFTFYCKNDLFSRWLSNFCGFSIDRYITKGSVAYLALTAARNMGCNPIILTGQDLAYTDGKFYSSGSFWGDLYNINEKNEAVESALLTDKKSVENKLKQLKETNFTRVKGQNGDTVLTSSDYAGFISHFEEFAEENSSELTLINCSTGGAQLEGFENRNLQNLSESLEPVNLNINEVLEDIILTEKDPVLENLQRVKAKLNAALSVDKNKLLQAADIGIKNCDDLLRELRNRQINPKKVKTQYTKIIESFTRLDDSLYNKYEFALGIVFQQLTEFNRLIQDESAQSDVSMFIDFAKTAKALFQVTYSRIKELNETILPFE